MKLSVRLVADGSQRIIVIDIAIMVIMVIIATNVNVVIIIKIIEQ